jgi:hypothetical protein
VTFNEVLSQFADDPLLKAVLVIIALDLVFGVLAAVVDKEQRFRFNRVAGFMLDDVVGKVFPWFVLYGASKFAPSVDVLGLSLDDVQRAAWAVASVALVASLVESLGQLRLTPVQQAIDKVPGLSTEEGS